MKKNIIKDSIKCLENATLEDTTYKIAINITLDYLKELKEENEKLEEDLDAEKSINSYLSRRILKAIEYIESYNLPKDLGKLSEAPISVNELKELLKILKGGENE
jgi:hypothetical protein